MKYMTETISWWLSKGTNIVISQGLSQKFIVKNNDLVIPSYNGIMCKYIFLIVRTTVWITRIQDVFLQFE